MILPTGGLTDSEFKKKKSQIEKRSKVCAKLVRIRKLAEKKKLTVRETEVYLALVKGFSNRQMGAAQFVAEKTIKFHTVRIFKKMNVKSRSELAAKVLGLYVDLGEL